MSDKNHVHQIEVKVTALSNALAQLGRGTGLADLLKIIHNPGWTTPAEFAMTIAIVDSMAAQVAELSKLESSLVAAARQVGAKQAVHA